jgi:hypothetical protein
MERESGVRERQREKKGGSERAKRRGRKLQRRSFKDEEREKASEKGTRT